MRDKLYDYLCGRPDGASARELLQLLFTRPGSDPALGERLLHLLVGDDPRFRRDGETGGWTVAPEGLPDRPLAETTFVVVDLETTGFGPGRASIIEIGAARVRGGRVVEEFGQLVNPGGPLPPFITGLTGITDAMLADAPRITHVWPRFRAFLGGDVLVAHNAAFDLAFLDAVATALDGAPLRQPHLCTLRLARRLLPRLRRRGLDALAAHFGIPQVARHRALGDVRITVEVLFHLLDLLAARGVTRLHGALALQRLARDGRPFVCPLPRARVEQLPPAPGVYRLLDADGAVLYVGRAANLRERVRTYLSDSDRHTDRTLELIRRACDVHAQVTGSELEAALEEAAAIRRERPPYNRLRGHLPRLAFVTLARRGPEPHLAVSTRLRARRSPRVGPFGTREEARRVAEMLGRLFGVRTRPAGVWPRTAADPAPGAPPARAAAGRYPLPGDDRAAYAARVTACERFLHGDTGWGEAELLRRREAVVAAGRREVADRAERDVKLLRRVVERRANFGWVTEGTDFLVLEPRFDRDGVTAYVVRDGRLVARSRVRCADELHGLLATYPSRFGRQADAGRVAEEVDGATILAAWLRDRGSGGGCVVPIGDPQGPATGPSRWWQAACEALEGLLAQGAVESPGGGNGVPPQAEGEREQQQQPGTPAVTFPGDRTTAAPR